MKFSILSLITILVVYMTIRLIIDGNPGKANIARPVAWAGIIVLQIIAFTSCAIIGTSDF